jgi:endonuclease/exonuclease/phosphatase family metal-dependent hydrolase
MASLKTSIVRALSWNLNGRTSRAVKQVAAVAERRPDIVALQEVTTLSVTALTAHLAAAGLRNATNSLSQAPPEFVPNDPRRYGQLLTSRYALNPILPGLLDVPWPERVLRAQVIMH